MLGVHIEETRLSEFSSEQLREGKEIIRLEAETLLTLAERLDTEFPAAVELILGCTGCVLVTGIGKAGIIGQKIAATLASTGTRSHFLHPAEAVHGDLGVIHSNDVVLILSNSGETEEVCRLLPLIRHWGNPIIAVTGNLSSTLASQARITIGLGRLREAGQHGLAPTTSAVAMLAVGDALALVISRMKNFTPRQFARIHPAGSLGQQLRLVDDVMRKGDQLRIASEGLPIREIYARVRKTGRRTGAVILVDGTGRLSGLFTDSDLARLLETRRDAQLDHPIHEVMTRAPKTIRIGASLGDAVTLLSSHRVSELPVVDAAHQPVGLIDITDVIGLMPPEALE
jgi:arabinose-5-phosphate isomerase